MSELQDALHRWETQGYPTWSARLPDEDVIIEAARLVANPDYEAATRAVDDEIGPEMREHLSHVLRKWPNTIATIAERAVDAALGIEDTPIVLTDDEQATLDRALDRMENMGID